MFIWTAIIVFLFLRTSISHSHRRTNYSSTSCATCIEQNNIFTGVQLMSGSLFECAIMSNVLSGWRRLIGRNWKRSLAECSGRSSILPCGACSLVLFHFPAESQRLIWLVIYQLKVLPPGFNGQCQGLVWIINSSIPGDQAQFISKQRQNEIKGWVGQSGH